MLSVALSQENNIDESKDTLIVNKVVKQPLLINDVKYDASDSIIINQKDNKISLYNNAKIIYGDIELTSGLIILDYKKNEVYAGRIVIKMVIYHSTLFLYKEEIQLIQTQLNIILIIKKH